MSLRVLLAGPIPQSYEERYRAAFASNDFFPRGALDVVVPPVADHGYLVSKVPEAEVLLVNGAGSFGYHNVQVDRPVIEAGRRLRLIQKIGRDLSSVDVKAARERGVTVATCLPVGVVAIAEHTMALVLALKRRLLYGHRLASAADNPAGLEPTLTTETAFAYNWARVDLTTVGVLDGATLGLVGFGETARQVALRARAFGMKILYFARRPASDEDQYGARFTTLERVLSDGDVVSIHVPYTHETHHMIDAARIALMKPSAVIVNTSRGRVIEERALTLALRDGRIAGAALDVLEHEPPFPGTEILELPNVIVTPHVATAAGPNRLMRELAVMFENVRRLLSGEPLVEVVA